MSGLSHRPNQIYHLWKFTLGSLNYFEEYIIQLLMFHLFGWNIDISTSEISYWPFKNGTSVMTVLCLLLSMPVSALSSPFVCTYEGHPIKNETFFVV